MLTVSLLIGKERWFTVRKAKRASVGNKRHDVNGNPTVYIAFTQKDCQACPVREQCTRSLKTGRSMTLRTQSDWQVLQQARVRQNTDDFKTIYATRALC